MNNIKPISFGEAAIHFFHSLTTPEVNQDVEILNPYTNSTVKSVVAQFYSKYYNDTSSRTFIIGVNPGRLGGGITGVSFTDPVALHEFCGIENNLGNTRELSSKFIYSMINAYGGPDIFYKRFYLTAIFPLAIVKEGKNYNYYDMPSLYDSLKNSVVSSLKTQIEFGANRKRAICLGKKNMRFMEMLNKEYSFFDRLEFIEHPRYIMQYKLKLLPQYIEKYHSLLNSIEV